MNSPWQLGEPVTLETRRLRIRTLVETDTQEMRSWLTEPAIRENLWIPDVDLATYFTWMARIADQKTRFAFAILSKQDDRVVGFAKLVLDLERRTQIPTIALGHPEFRERGFGSEATLAVQSFVFDNLPVDRIEIRVYGENTRLRARLLRDGCHETKVYEERAFGRPPRLVHVLELGREGWQRWALEVERSLTGLANDSKPSG